MNRCSCLSLLCCEHSRRFGARVARSPRANLRRAGVGVPSSPWFEWHFRPLRLTTLRVVL